MPKYALPSDHPVNQPVITNALFEAIHQKALDAGRKPTAFETLFRHSDAGKCARQMAYNALGVEQSDPPDIAGEWVMWLGTMIHEALQEALMFKFPGAVSVEPKVRHEDLCSGHLDAVVTFSDPELGKVCYELKTKGGYGFDKAIGLNRKAYKQEFPEGPGMMAKLQGALNAAAVDADTLIIGVIGLESVSRGLAERIGASDLARICAEWHYDRTEYIPWAKDELARMDRVRYSIEHDLPVHRIAIGDEGQDVALDPNSSRPDWRCQYCSWKTICQGGVGDAAIIQ